MIKMINGQWVNEDGKGGTYELGGARDEVLKREWAKKVGRQRSNVGNFMQYKDGSVKDLKGLLGGEKFFYSRLPKYANAIMSGNPGEFNFQFDASSGGTERAQELTNRYIALKMNGMADSEIMGELYGGAPSTWASWDAENTDVVKRYRDPTGWSSENSEMFYNSDAPSEDISSGGFMGAYKDHTQKYAPEGDYLSASQPTVPAATPGGFMEAYQKRKEADTNRQSVKSLFKGMIDE